MSGVKITCNGKDEHDCSKCNKYWSWSSLRYSRYYGKKVSEYTCSIGGTRIFDEDGNMIAKD